MFNISNEEVIIYHMDLSCTLFTKDGWATLQTCIEKVIKIR